MLIWTTNSYNSVWEHLNIFQSKEAVRRLLTNQTGWKSQYSYVDNDITDVPSLRRFRTLVRVYRHCFQ